MGGDYEMEYTGKDVDIIRNLRTIEWLKVRF